VHTPQGTELGTRPKKDPLFELGCVVPSVIAIAFFVYVDIGDPAATRISAIYIAAILFLVGVVTARGRANPYSRAAKTFADSEVERVRLALGERIDGLLLLSPREFEIALGRLFETQGWDVVVTPASGDGGKDLVLQREGMRILVEAKQFSPERKVGRPLVMKLHSAVTYERANGGILITTSKFTEPAREFAELNQLSLVDGAHLATMLAVAYPVRHEPMYLRAMCRKCGEVVPFKGSDHDTDRCSNGHLIKNPFGTPGGMMDRPGCPKCGAQMARIRIKGSRYYRLKCPVCGSGIMSWEQ